MMKYILSLLMFTASASAVLTDVDKALLVNQNILTNPGFENGRAQWVASAGTFAAVTSGTNLLTGRSSVTWDSSAAAQTLTSAAVTIPKGRYGQNGIAYCAIQTPSGLATHTINVFDGTNLIATNAVTSSEFPTRASVNFIFPASGTIAIRISSVNANEPLVAIDDCYLGEATNLTNVSQAVFAGTSFFAGTTNCGGWTRTSVTLGAFATDADCPGPTVESALIGTWATTDVNLPEQTITNLPPGRYRAKFNIVNFGSASTAASFAINDGTTTCRGTGGSMATTINAQTIVECWFNYTATQASVSFEIFAASTSGTVTLDNAVTSPLSTHVIFSLERWPLSSEQAFAADIINWKLDLNISGGNPDLGASDVAAYIAPNSTVLTMVVNAAKGSASAGISCSSTNDAAVGALTCSAGSEEIGFVANFPRAGLVELCFNFTHFANAGAAGVVSSVFQIVRTANGSQTIVDEGGSRLQSGAATANVGVVIPNSICSNFQIPSAAKHTFRLMYEQDVTATVAGNLIIADGSATIGQRDILIRGKYIDQSMTAPLVRNAVVSSSAGVTAMLSGFITNTGTPVVTREDGDWLGTVTDSGVGLSAHAINAGIFSSTPNCFATASTGVGNVCYVSTTIPISSTNVQIQCVSSSFTAQDSSYFLFCAGPK